MKFRFVKASKISTISNRKISKIFKIFRNSMIFSRFQWLPISSRFPTCSRFQRLQRIPRLQFIQRILSIKTHYYSKSLVLGEKKCLKSNIYFRTDTAMSKTFPHFLRDKLANYRVSHETWQLVNGFECFLPYFILIY